ncbi:MAG: MFS transporter, partial [Planctomycetota bacterium]
MLQRAVASFHPRSQPWGTRAAYRRELVASSTFPAAVAMLEGGVVGVLAKTVFDVSNLGFATIAAAPMFANLTSLFWTRAARGRRKPAFVAAVMAALLLLVAAVGLLPTEGWGPAGLVVAVVVGRCLLAGMIAVRSAIWRMNYPRAVRARVTGKLVVIATLLLGLVPLAVGPLIDWRPGLFRAVYPAAALVGACAIFAFLGMRVRQEPQLLRSETAPPDDRDTAPRQPDGRRHTLVSVLRHDRHFRAYMTWQFVAGVCNMMGNTAFLLFVIDAVEHRDDANTLGMLLGTTVPLAVTTATVPLWSRLLDAAHIARYRVFHGLTWILGQSSCYLAAVSGQLWLFFLPMALRGVMQGGGMIAWQLGHNDFADRRLAALYMGIHQTLTGLRGAFAPFLGVLLLAGWGPATLPGTGHT